MSEGIKFNRYVFHETGTTAVFELDSPLHRQRFDGITELVRELAFDREGLENRVRNLKKDGYDCSESEMALTYWPEE